MCGRAQVGPGALQQGELEEEGVGQIQKQSGEERELESSKVHYQWGIKNIFAENKELVKKNYTWNLPPMDGTRFCTQSIYNFNVKPISFGVGIHKDVIWNAGSIYSESEYLDYYGRADINSEYMHRMATKKWMEGNLYYDHVMGVFNKIS